MTLNRYVESQSIIQGRRMHVEKGELTKTITATNAVARYDSEINVAALEFVIASDIQYYSRYPDSLLMALAKLGGLLALFKISFFLQFLHRKLFE